MSRALPSSHLLSGIGFRYGRHAAALVSFLARTGILVVTPMPYASHGQIRVGCIGNSITEYSGYPERLGGLLGSKCWMWNGGESGKCVLKKAKTGTVEGPYWGCPHFQFAFVFKPSIITVMLGTNDAKTENWTAHKDEFFGDYSALIDTFLDMNPPPVIYLCLPTPVFPPSCCNIEPDFLNNQVVALVDSLARKKHLPLIDCHTPLLSYSRFFTDGVHADSNAAKIIAQCIYTGVDWSGTRARPLTPVARGSDQVSDGVGNLGIRRQRGRAPESCDTQGRIIRPVQAGRLKFPLSGPLMEIPQLDRE